MDIDIIQHIVSVERPLHWMNLMKINLAWHHAVRRVVKTTKPENAIQDCNPLALTKHKRHFIMPLILAQMCRVNDPEIKMVIKFMKQQNIRDWNPAIAAACEAGQAQLVNYLLKRFTKYSWRKSKWFKESHFKVDMHTALANACYSGSRDTITLVLKWLHKVVQARRYYVYPVTTAIHWWHAFYMACRNGNLENIKLIRNHVPDTSLQEGLSGAYRGGQMHVIKLLESEGFRPDESCILDAIKSCNLEVLEKAASIQHICLVDRTIIESTPPAIQKYINTMRNVIIHDKPINVKYYDACQEGDIERVHHYERTCLRHNPTRNMIFREYGLLFACRYGQREMMNYFIQDGVRCPCARSHDAHLRYINYKKFNWVSL
jgi:hypothetical protein